MWVGDVKDWPHCQRPGSRAKGGTACSAAPWFLVSPPGGDDLDRDILPSFCGYAASKAAIEEVLCNLQASRDDLHLLCRYIGSDVIVNTCWTPGQPGTCGSRRGAWSSRGSCGWLGRRCSCRLGYTSGGRLRRRRGCGRRSWDGLKRWSWSRVEGGRGYRCRCSCWLWRPHLLDYMSRRRQSRSRC